MSSNGDLLLVSAFADKVVLSSNGDMLSVSAFADTMATSPNGDIRAMSPSYYLRSARAVGELVRRVRRERGLDQATLARRVGVSRQWISEIENGKSSAELGLVLRTFAALDVQIFGAAREASPEPAAVD